MSDNKYELEPKKELAFRLILVARAFFVVAFFWMAYIIYLSSSVPVLCIIWIYFGAKILWTDIDTFRTLWAIERLQKIGKRLDEQRIKFEQMLADSKKEQENGKT